MRLTTKRSVLLIAGFLGIGVFFYACRKNSNSIPSVKENVTELQAWLHSYGKVYARDQMTVKNSNGEASIYKLNWDLISSFKSKNSFFFEVPFVDAQSNPTCYSIVFQKGADNIAARVKYTYENLNRETSVSGYSKVALFDKLDGENETSWAWFNGLNFPTKIYKKKATVSAATTNKTTSTREIKTTVADDCRPILVPSYEYHCWQSYEGNPNEVTCGYIRTGYETYTMCFESSSGSNLPGGESGPAPGGGSGGGEGEFNYDDYLEVNNRIIVDSLAGYPCAQNILATMFNINDSLSSLIKTLFGDTNNVDITFSVNYNLAGTGVDGETKPGGTVVRPPVGSTTFTFAAEVTLNPDVLNNATREYMAITFMHEALHAYIGYYLHLLSNNLISRDVFSSKFPIYATYRYDSLTTRELAQHNEMAELYINKMAAFLKYFNTRMPDSVAVALAWGGLAETTAWKSRSDTNSIKNMNWIARDASLPGNQIWKLKKCP